MSRFLADAAVDDQSVSFPDSTVVNARLTRRLTRTTFASLDVFNVFDRRSSVDEFTMSRLWSPGGTPGDFLVIRASRAACASRFA